MPLQLTTFKLALEVGIRAVIFNNLPAALESATKNIEDKVKAGYYQTRADEAKHDMAIENARSFANIFSTYLDDIIADAIDVFIRGATVTIPAGVPVSVTPGTWVGGTTAPGIGTIS